VAIGLAGSGFFFANSATVSSIARTIGIRATPLFLSIQPYEPSAFASSSRAVLSFSSRALARFCSYVSPRGAGPMTASTITPKRTNKSTMPSQAEKGARDRPSWRIDSASGISVGQF